MEQGTPMPSSAKIIKPTWLWLAVIVAIAALITGGYFWRQNYKKTPEEKAAEAVDQSLKAATSGSLPEIAPLTSPLEKSPEINPMDVVNPFKDVYKNPFE